MSDEMTVYQCPHCNGPLHFDSKLQKLKCDSCGSEYTTQEIDDLFSKKNAEAVQESSQIKNMGEWNESEKENLRAYNCPACGARLITDASTGATSCPYCGNPTIIPSQFEKAYRPDYIIPFQLKKEDAISKIKDFYKGMPFLPKAFSEENHIEEIKGVYVPFWLYDSKADGHIRAHCTRMHTHREGDYEVTRTSHYLVIRDGNLRFEKVPADGSSKMPDDFMDSIEPYDLNALVPFQLSYLPGFLADRYDVDYKETESRADLRMKNTTLDELRSTIIGYTSVLPEDEHVQLQPGNVSYALLPVWLLSTRYHDKTYLFAMNGQTGKMIADNMPKDAKKIVLTFVLTFAITFAITFAVLYFLQR